MQRISHSVQASIPVLAVACTPAGHDTRETVRDSRAQLLAGFCAQYRRGDGKLAATGAGVLTGTRSGPEIGRATKS